MKIYLILFFLIFLTALTNIHAQNDPKEAEARQLMNEIIQNLNEKNFEKIIVKATRVLELYPNSSDILVTRGLAYISLSQIENGVADLTSAINLGVSPKLEETAYRTRGIMLQKLKRYDDSVKDFDFLIGKNKTKMYDFVFQGWNYFYKNNHPKAIYFFDIALKMNPKEAEIRRYRAFSHYNVGSYEKTVEDITEELRINQSPHIEIYELRAKAYRKLGKNELADADEKKFVELGGKFVNKPQVKQESFDEKIERLLNKADKHFSEEDWDSAIQTFDEILSLVSKDDENLYAIYFVRGRCYYEKSNYDLAIKDYTESIKRRPDLSSGYTFRGEAYLRKNQLDIALGDFNKAIQLDIKDLLAFRRRAEVYFLKNDFNNAIKDASEVIKLDAKYKSAWFIRADSYFEKSDYKSALADINEYIKLDTETSEAYNLRAKIYRKLGKIKEAEADEKKVRELEAAQTTK